MSNHNGHTRKEKIMRQGEIFGEILQHKSTNKTDRNKSYGQVSCNKKKVAKSWVIFSLFNGLMIRNFYSIVI